MEEPTMRQLSLDEAKELLERLSDGAWSAQPGEDDRVLITNPGNYFEVSRERLIDAELRGYVSGWIATGRPRGDGIHEPAK